VPGLPADDRLNPRGDTSRESREPRELRDLGELRDLRELRNPRERPFDVLTMGRVGVDIYPLQVGVGLDEVTSFGKFVGGSATNVAVAAARLGRRSAVITRTGRDPFGRFIRRALRGYGVDDRFVAEVPSLPTPVTFCEIFPPDHFPIYFYRYPKAPDLEIRAEDLDEAAITGCGVFWVTVTGLSAEPSRSATLAALEWRAKSGITVLDLDYRPAFWPSREHARCEVERALPHVTAAVGNLDECETAVGTADPHVAAERLRAAGVELAVVKQGPAGVLAVDDSSLVEEPPVPVQVVNGIGAGDAFGGALCHGLLAGWKLADVIQYANAAGAIVASRLACSDAMPTPAEVAELLERAGRVR
jgi:5-dehydro-2-deoxygluconokinase